jgi:hypothetical protein
MKVWPDYRTTRRGKDLASTGIKEQSRWEDGQTGGLEEGRLDRPIFHP